MQSDIKRYQLLSPGLLYQGFKKIHIINKERLDLEQLVNQMVNSVLTSDESIITETMIEPMIEPMTEPMTETMIEPMTEPMIEPMIEPNIIFDKLVYPLIDEYNNSIITCNMCNTIYNNLIQKRDVIQISIDTTNDKIKKYTKKKLILDKLIKCFKTIETIDKNETDSTNIPSTYSIKNELITVSTKMISELESDIQICYLINNIKYKNITDINKNILKLNMSHIH